MSRSRQLHTAENDRRVAKAAKLENYDSAMPAYEKVLVDSEIVAALSWIKAQWPGEIKTKHDKMNASVARNP